MSSRVISRHMSRRPQYLKPNGQLSHMPAIFLLPHSPSLASPHPSNPNKSTRSSHRRCAIIMPSPRETQSQEQEPDSVPRWGGRAPSFSCSSAASSRGSRGASAPSRCAPTRVSELFLFLVFFFLVSDRRRRLCRAVDLALTGFVCRLQGRRCR